MGEEACGRGGLLLAQAMMRKGDRTAERDVIFLCAAWRQIIKHSSPGTWAAFLSVWELSSAGGASGSLGTN